MWGDSFERDWKWLLVRLAWFVALLFLLFVWLPRRCSEPRVTTTRAGGLLEGTRAVRPDEKAFILDARAFARITGQPEPKADGVWHVKTVSGDVGVLSYDFVGDEFGVTCTIKHYESESSAEWGFHRSKPAQVDMDELGDGVQLDLALGDQTYAVAFTDKEGERVANLVICRRGRSVFSFLCLVIALDDAHLAAALKPYLERMAGWHPFGEPPG